MRQVQPLAGDAFDVARVLRVDLAAGTVACAPLPGRPLSDLLATPGGEPAALALGSALRALHAAPPPPDADRHEAPTEITLLGRVTEELEPYAPALAARARIAASAAARRLAALDGADAAPLHRDLHDKQVLVAADGRIGLIDFDTLAVGDPALDVGNLLAHLDLRALQGRCTRADAERLAGALLEGYGASAALRRRAGAYAAATCVRLACVYAFRPAWQHLADPLLKAAAAPPEAGRTRAAIG
jgi:aminoglycoside phosphotransferase (APT) family kinase protein